ncbi:MAG: hypothetical protein WCK18_19625 [Prolixibacteraceae bacterium]
MSNSTEIQEEKKPSLVEKLVEAFTLHYEPAIDVSDSDEMKSTRDILAEMNSIDEIFPYEVNKLMEDYGFKIHYNGNNFVWLLKEK